MSTDVVCEAFQQHAWKKELCANCLKARSQHVGVPVPTKRTSINTTLFQDAPGGSGEAEEGKTTIVGGKTVRLSGRDARGPSPRRQMGGESADKCNSLGEGGKPADVKPKPTIASKPSKLHKQTSDEKLKMKELTLRGEEAATSPGGDGEMEDPGVAVETTTTKQAASSGVVMRYSAAKSAAIRPDVTARTRKSKSSRPISPPPSAPGGVEPTYGENREETRPDDGKDKCAADKAVDSSETGKTHFYHEYDVSGRGTLPSGVKRRKGLDTVPTQPYKVVDLTGPAAACVQPYTIVDVTSTPPPQPLDHPPKQPSSPAPDQENSGGSSCSHGSSYSGGSVGSRKSRTSSESSDKVVSLRKTETGLSKRDNTQGTTVVGSGARDRVRVMSPKMSMKSSKDSEQLKDEGRSPKTAHKVPITIQRQLVQQQHTYEEISRDGSMSHDQDDTGAFMRQTSSRASAIKSASFEAKVAALSNLNLSSYSKDGDKKQAENESERKIPAKTPPVSRRLNCSLAASQNVKCANKSPPASAKNKKGPTSFFKKLLGIGGRSNSNELGGDSCRKIEEFDRRSYSLDVDAKETDLEGEDKRDSLRRKTTLEYPGRTSVRKDSLPRLPDDLKEAIEKAGYIPKTESQPVCKVPSPRPRTDISSCQRQPSSRQSDITSRQRQHSPRLSDITSTQRQSDITSSQRQPSPRQSSPAQKTDQKDVVEQMVEPDEEEIYGTQKAAETEEPSTSSITPSVETAAEDIACEDPAVETVEVKIESTTETTEDTADGDTEAFSDEGSGSRRESVGEEGRTTLEGAIKMRSKSESQAKAARAARRMLSAPPPPPPGSSTLSIGSCDLSLPVSPPVSPPSPHGLSISGPIAISGSVGVASTLPRLGRAQDGRRRVSTDDQQCSRRLSSAQKHARNKTVSEGIKLEDISIICGRSDNDQITRSLDTRVSKFFNRALPLPPTDEKIPEEGATDENIYEFVSSQKEPNGKAVIERDNYEDIEDDEGIYSSPWDLNNSIQLMGLSSKQRDEITKDFTTVSNENDDEYKLPRAISTDYLEPVSQADMLDRLVEKPQTFHSAKSNGNGVVVTAARSDWYPHPAMTCSLQKNKKLHYSIAEPYVTMFADSGRILDKDRLALNSREGFNKMCLSNLETLQLICEGMYIEFVNVKTQFWQDARWADFDLVREKPTYVAGPVAFYKARSSRVTGSKCLLMINCKSVNRDLLQCRHANVISPVAMFADKIPSDFFPDQSDSSDTYQLFGDIDTNIAVLNYHSIDSIDHYCHEMALLYGNDNEKYDRCVCYILAQIMNALLYVHDRIHSVSSLQSYSVAVVTCVVSSEKRIILNPMKQNDSCGLPELCDDIVMLLTRDLLQGRTSSIPSTRYSRGFTKVVHVLKTGADLDAVICARNMLEFLLWGPVEEDIEILLLAEQREHTFHVWLELVRCRCVNTLALERNAPTVEAADRLKFLCSVNGQSLYQTAKLLGL